MAKTRTSYKKGIATGRPKGAINKTNKAVKKFLQPFLATFRTFALDFSYLNSCAPTKIIPLKGQYPGTPMVFNSEKSFEQTWDNLIDVFAQKGLSIKIIDKSIGLIISQRSTLSTTIEDKNGKLYDSTAFIAIPSYISYGKRVPVTNLPPGAYSTQKKIISNPVMENGM